MDNDEKIRILEKEVAIMGQMAKTHRAELNELFELMRKHMAKEEKERSELIGLISQINIKIAKEKSFFGGITFAVSAVWAIGIVVWHYYTKK
jgi:hypothetical protein